MRKQEIAVAFCAAAALCNNVLYDLLSVLLMLFGHSVYHIVGGGCGGAVVVVMVVAVVVFGLQWIGGWAGLSGLTAWTFLWVVLICFNVLCCVLGLSY